MIERAWPAVYPDDPTREALRRSWRWLLNRLVGLVERDEAAARVLLGTPKVPVGDPSVIESWFRARAEDPRPGRG